MLCFDYSSMQKVYLAKKRSLMPQRQAEAHLRQAGLRVTQQRLLVLSVLQKAEDHPRAEDILERVRAQDSSMSFSTVYRVLLCLEEAGLVQRLNIENEPARFELASNVDHNHLIDEVSGDVLEIKSDELICLIEDIVQEMGYDILSHQLIVRARRKE
jgi:Fur family ferric uptake transcriptional regulator